jgi:hypothetical protein
MLLSQDSDRQETAKSAEGLFKQAFVDFYTLNDGNYVPQQL